jgi:hypothetical protein
MRPRWRRSSKFCGSPLFSLLQSFIHQLRKILISLSNTLTNLDQCATAFKLQLFAFAKRRISPPMGISYVIRPLIVDHYPFVEGVELESAILPAFLLTAQILRVQASEL